MEEKYALFDTDFISKMHLIQKDADNHLIDRILEMPSYRFFCHEQIVKELKKNPTDASVWLDKKIQEGSIICYSDKQILEKLSEVYGNSACLAFTRMLSDSCEVLLIKRWLSLHRIMVGTLCCNQ